MNQNELYGKIKACEEQLKEQFEKLEDISFFNQNKILEAMQHNRLSERHFTRSTGYGYNDEGREVCEKVFAEVFGGEKALVRPQIVSGTHAIALSLFGLLRPGDELLSITGTPYDTIQTVIGLNEEYLGDGTLKEYNITYSQVNLLSNGNFDINNILNNINHNTKVIYIQRSTGYEKRSAITLNKMKSVIRKMKEYKNDLIVFIDNCYGEFIEQQEPLNVGADVIAGSLIKNPGGGLAESGGYIVGKENYVKKIAARLTAPGLDFEVGANWGVVRSYLQGLFIAPQVAKNALKGAVLTAKFFEDEGYEVFPKYNEERSDIIQALVLNSKEKVLTYCAAVQSSSPVDAYVTPLPWDMPGYEDEIIMAAGNFIQGSSIELSADAPMREPYIVYQQGGLTYEHIKIALMRAYNALEKMK